MTRRISRDLIFCHRGVLERPVRLGLRWRLAIQVTLLPSFRVIAQRDIRLILIPICLVTLLTPLAPDIASMSIQIARMTTTQTRMLRRHFPPIQLPIFCFLRFPAIEFLEHTPFSTSNRTAPIVCYFPPTPICRPRMALISCSI